MLMHCFMILTKDTILILINVWQEYAVNEINYQLSLIPNTPSEIFELHLIS